MVGITIILYRGEKAITIASGLLNIWIEILEIKQECLLLVSQFGL